MINLLRVSFILGLLVGAISTQSAETPLSIRQEGVTQSVDEFEQVLLRLSEALREEEPDLAEHLLYVLETARERGISEEGRRLVALLDKKQLETARNRQDELTEDLREVLVALMTPKSERERLEERLRQLKDWQQQVQQLAREEWAQMRENQQTQDPDASAQDLGKQIEQVKALIARQEKLKKETDAKAGKAEGGDTEGAEAQEKLAGDTQALADSLPPEGEKDTPNRTPEPGEEALENAVGAQEKAAEAMGQQGQQGASEQQEQALEQLRQALAEMERAKEELENTPENNTEQLADMQKGTEEETGKLEQEMKSEGSGQEAATNQEIASSLGEAQQDMSQAGQQLGQGSSGQGSASQSQQQAHEDLNEADDQLQEEIENTEEALRDQKRRQIQANLEQMLQRQRVVLQRTQFLDGRRADDVWGKPEKELSVALAREESALNKLASDVHAILAEEGGTIVFISLAESIRDTLSDLSGRLGQEKVGETSQFLEQQVIDDIMVLLDALEGADQEPQDPEEQEPQEGEPGEQPPPPLISPLEELMALRGLQGVVHRQTVRLETRKAEAKEASGENERVHGRQAEVTDLANGILRMLLEQNGSPPIVRPFAKSPQDYSVTPPAAPDVDEAIRMFTEENGKGAGDGEGDADDS